MTRPVKLQDVRLSLEVTGNKSMNVHALITRFAKLSGDVREPSAGSCVISENSIVHCVYLPISPAANSHLVSSSFLLLSRDRPKILKPRSEQRQLVLRVSALEDCALLFATNVWEAEILRNWRDTDYSGRFNFLISALYRVSSLRLRKSMLILSHVMPSSRCS
jgi:hypothetical protein